MLGSKHVFEYVVCQMFKCVWNSSDIYWLCVWYTLYNSCLICNNYFPRKYISCVSRIDDSRIIDKGHSRHVLPSIYTIWELQYCCVDAYTAHICLFLHIRAHTRRQIYMPLNECVWSPMCVYVVYQKTVRRGAVPWICVVLFCQPYPMPQLRCVQQNALYF